MRLIPAIDLLDGQCVRLLHGDFNQVTVYDEDPAGLARRYFEAGAEWLHLVDLAASRDGEGADTSALFALIDDAEIKVQTGGGVRDEGGISLRMEAGAARVVVGSIAARSPEQFAAWLGRFDADRLVAALDVRIDRHGVPRPHIHGWTEAAREDLWDLLARLTDSGLKHVLVTDISRDGALGGPNLDLYLDIVARHPGLKVQASGGVAAIDDLRALADTGVDAAITGKALLEGRFTVVEALEALA